MEMNFNPTGGAGDVLTVIFCSPALDEAHADSAHLGELVDGLKAIVHRLSQQLRKLLVIEDLEAAAAGDLAHSGGVEAVVVVAVSALNEDAGVTQALGIDLSTDIVKVNSFADVAPGVLDCGVAVDVGQQAQAESVLVVRGVCEAINQHAGGRSIEGLSHSVIQLVIHNGTPVLRLHILHWLHTSPGHVHWDSAAVPRFH